MPSTVTLQNKTKQVLVLNLPHHIVPECAVLQEVYTSEMDKATGRRVMKSVKKPLSGSVTLVANGNCANLPLSVQRAPDVVNAVNAGKITLTVQE